VIYGLNGHLTGYDARTGRPRWTIPGGVPQYPALQVAGGFVLVNSNATGPSIPNTLTAVIAATGRAAWRAAMPTFVQSPPVLVPGGILVQPADPVYACATTG